MLFMLKRMSVGTLAAVAMTGTAHAYVLIDDFTVGEYSQVLTGEQSYLKVSSNLDRAHSVFGWRQSYTDILDNPSSTALKVSIIGGQQKFESDKQLYWDHELKLGDNTTTVDFSAETEFRVDFYTLPNGGFADFWDILVLDADGVDASNGGWLLRQGGIYFRKQAFSRPVDWSRISTIEFTQNWNAAPNPTTYTVTKFYAVPEPSLLLITFPILVWVRRQAQSKLAAR